MEMLLVWGLMALSSPIVADDLRDHIVILASDEYEGRKPGQRGEALTTAYIASAWHRAGLEGGYGDDGQWYAPAGIVIEKAPPFELTFKRNAERLDLDTTRLVAANPGQPLNLDSVPVVFTGLSDDVERNSKENVEGKFVLAIGDSAFYVRANAIIDAGAAGVMLAFEDNPPYEIVDRVMRQDRLAMPVEMGSAPFFATDMQDLEKLLGGRLEGNPLATAMSENFTPIEVEGLTVDADVAAPVLPFVTHNVIGKLKGSDPHAGAIMVLGHWDHLGLCRRNQDDRICNGANDNGTGIAAMIEIAERLANEGPWDRDIYFLATTAEETNLLGATGLMRDPAFDKTRIVAAFNIDMIGGLPQGYAAAIVNRTGVRFTELLEKVIKEAGYPVDTDDEAKDLINRSDHWPLIEAGVPAVAVSTTYSDRNALNDFFASHYHAPSDEVEGLELGSAVDTANINLSLLRCFASTTCFADDDDESAGVGESPLP